MGLKACTIPAQLSCTCMRAAGWEAEGRYNANGLLAGTVHRAAPRGWRAAWGGSQNKLMFFPR